MKILYKNLMRSVATLVFVHFVTSVGSAAINYVPDQGFALSADGESGLVDIGGLNKPLNFTVIQSVSTGAMFWQWEPTVSNFHQFVPDLSAGASPIRFEAGVEIDDDLFWTNNSRNVADLANSGETFRGTFFDAKGFLAVRFYEEQFGWENEEALPYYGWIRVSHNAEDVALTVHDWAWNSTAGESILAGQIPEPAAYAVMLAAGVLGFVIIRRRRRNGSV